MADTLVTRLVSIQTFIMSNDCQVVSLVCRSMTCMLTLSSFKPSVTVALVPNGTEASQLMMHLVEVEVVTRLAFEEVCLRLLAVLYLPFFSLLGFSFCF